MAWCLCSKQDVMAHYPVPESELKDQWSDEVDALIRQHLGMPHLGVPMDIVGEIHDGDGTHILPLNKPPVISVSRLDINEVPLIPNDYVVFPTYIALRAQVFPEGILNVEVDYRSGSTTVDHQVRLTAAAMIIAIYNFYKRMGSDASLKWASPDQKAGEESPSRYVGLTSHLNNIMKRLLRRSRVRAR